jgi:hypothetical protein
MMTRGARHWQLAASIGLGLQSLVAAAVAGLALVKLASGQTQVMQNEAMVAVTVAGLAVALGLLARSFGQGRGGGLSLALVWHALVLLALGGGLWQSDHHWAGVVVSVTAIVVSGLCLLAVPVEHS